MNVNWTLNHTDVHIHKGLCRLSRNSIMQDKQAEIDVLHFGVFLGLLQAVTCSTNRQTTHTYTYIRCDAISVRAQFSRRCVSFASKIQVKMYFAVLLTDFGIEVVVPWTWIENCKKVLKKFMFFGLNQKKNQIHWCYYSNRDDAQICENGVTIPNSAFQADFTIARGSRFPCDAGVFRCKVLDYFGKFLVTQRICECFIWI